MRSQNDLSASAVVTAGGTGVRMGLEQPKQFVEILGKPLMIHTLLAFEQCDKIDHIILTLPSQYLCDWPIEKFRAYGIEKLIGIVSGGQTRALSVLNGLEAFESKPDYVAIHDAARCLVLPSMIEQTLLAAQKGSGAIAASKVTDTLKRVLESGLIEQTIDRKNIWAMQTPQIFKYENILKAYRHAKEKGIDVSDDAAALECLGFETHICEIKEPNFKVTTQEDLHLAQFLLSRRT